MTDINAVIARFKGYTRPDEKYMWIDSVGQSVASIPDFQHDARLYMALFEEIEFARLIKRGEYFAVEIPNENGKFVCYSLELHCGDAVTLAYMRLHGLECEK